MARRGNDGPDSQKSEHRATATASYTARLQKMTNVGIYSKIFLISDCKNIFHTAVNTGTLLLDTRGSLVTTTDSGNYGFG